MERLAISSGRVARLKQMRTQWEETMVRRETRRAAAELSAQEREAVDGKSVAYREEAELRAWIEEEAVAMLREGWTPEQLGEFGFAPEIIGRAAARAGAAE
ncbi:MAG TPA: hypothetical protein VF665_16535 [Longimicrobium sp.]